MQVKTIKKNIQKKMNEWLLTITDEELRRKVKNNLLVSGGSIVSLLLKETVNDYDVYIKDMDILIELATYYIPTFFSPNAISLSNNVQIITRFHGNNEEIHKTFDFIHATNYFTFKDGLVTNKEALESIICKQLKYQGSLYPLTSIIRMKKFIKRGWNINAGEILKIMFQISELDLKNPNILEEQLIGVDVAYFAQLIEILRTVSPEKITSSYLNEIIDRVFNTADEDIEANTTLVNDVNEVTF